MKTILICSFALWSVAMSLGRPQPSCCRLEVAGTSTTNPGELTVTVTNLQDTPVNVLRTRPEWDIRVKIVPSDGSGRTPEFTPYGKQVLTEERGGSMLNRELKRGEMFSQTLDLGKIYVLKTGYYSVTVDRDVFIDDHRITLEAKTTVGIP